MEKHKHKIEKETKKSEPKNEKKQNHVKIKIAVNPKISGNRKNGK